MLKKILCLLFAGAMLAGLTGCRTAGGENEPAGATVGRISLEDSDMEYAVFGKGTKNFVIIPGLSVHGVMGAADAIADAYQSFTDDYTVYVFDAAGKLPGSYSVRDLSDDIAEAMTQLGIPDADIFGASLGGMTAMRLAIDHPELVNKMVLGSTFAKPNDTFSSLISEWIGLAEEKKEAELLGSFVDHVYSDATLEAYRDYLLSSNAGISDEEYERFLILAEAIRSFDCYSELSDIRCPVLVLGSEGDMAVTAEGPRQIAEALNCEIHLYGAEYGHAVYDEAPDYKQRCLDFFRSDSPPLS